MGVGAITMPTVVALTEQNSPTSSSTPADKINLTCFFFIFGHITTGFLRSDWFFICIANPAF